ncbi:GIY-YIG nuclease family protein [Metaclostridioides mangenotii]|uniref:GIY-YIG nuclease family protein n=1 Tax=Metaclostridioides mangenotii TaxID=1540 RepID=UPI002FE66F6D
MHATIFSEDAPTLENVLHKAFNDERVNKVNSRKEFFNVSLEEIRQEVERNHNKTVEYTKLAEAMEYRQTLKLEEKEKLEKAIV